jgi:hypothetical protein
LDRLDDGLAAGEQRAGGASVVSVTGVVERPIRGARSRLTPYGRQAACSASTVARHRQSAPSVPRDRCRAGQALGFELLPGLAQALATLHRLDQLWRQLVAARVAALAHRGRATDPEARDRRVVGALIGDDDAKRRPTVSIRSIGRVEPAAAPAPDRTR